MPHNVYIRLVKSRHSIYDELIAWYTRSDYVHAEFAYPLDNPDPEQWLGAQPKGGVRIRPKDYLPNAKYDLFNVNVTSKQYNAIHLFLRQQLYKKYDWKAIVNMGVFRHDVSSPDRWFCSELVYAGFGVAQVYLLRMPLKEKDRITPRDIGISTIIEGVNRA